MGSRTSTPSRGSVSTGDIVGSCTDASEVAVSDPYPADSTSQRAQTSSLVAQATEEAAPTDSLCSRDALNPAACATPLPGAVKVPAESATKSRVNVPSLRCPSPRPPSHPRLFASTVSSPSDTLAPRAAQLRSTESSSPLSAGSHPIASMPTFHSPDLLAPHSPRREGHSLGDEPLSATTIDLSLLRVSFTVAIRLDDSYNTAAAAPSASFSSSSSFLSSSMRGTTHPAEEAPQLAAAVEQQNSNNDSTSAILYDGHGAAGTPEGQGVVVPLTPTWMKHRHQQAVPRRRCLAALHHHHHRTTTTSTTVATPDSPCGGSRHGCAPPGVKASNPTEPRDLSTSVSVSPCRELSASNSSEERASIEIIK